MFIQCTKKLLAQMRYEPEHIDEPEQPLFSWHANLLTINRRKAVVLMNDASRYVIVLYGLKARDFSHLDTYIPEAI